MPGPDPRPEQHPEQHPDQRPDEQLMSACAQGSQPAFAELFARYRQPIFGFFRRRLPSTANAPASDLAEDLTQETFLALLRAAPRYQPSALFRTWLYAIALRILHAHRRKAAFRALFHASEAPEPATLPTLDASLILRQALHQLPAVDREILLLREFEQLSYAEIAALLHLPLNTVRSRLFRARTALREGFATPAPTLTHEPSFTQQERI